MRNDFLERVAQQRAEEQLRYPHLIPGSSEVWKPRNSYGRLLGECLTCRAKVSAWNRSGKCALCREASRPVKLRPESTPEQKSRWKPKSEIIRLDRRCSVEGCSRRLRNRGKNRNREVCWVHHIEMQFTEDFRRRSCIRRRRHV